MSPSTSTFYTLPTGAFRKRNRDLTIARQFPHELRLVWPRMLGRLILSEMSRCLLLL